MRAVIWTLLFLAVMAGVSQTAYAENPTPRPTRLPTPLPGGGMVPAWMTPPAPGPTQADAGAVVYYYRCMACHGDQQQGLTVAWRAQWDVEHQDCSRSMCHGARPPPEGFTFPKNFAPPLIGPNTLVKYSDAQELFDFVRARMPYQAPGSLSVAEYWQLVAFLLKRRGVSVTHLDEKNARAITWQPSPYPVPEQIAAGAALFTIAAASVLYLHKRSRKTASK